VGESSGGQRVEPRWVNDKSRDHMAKYQGDMIESHWENVESHPHNEIIWNKVTPPNRRNTFGPYNAFDPVFLLTGTPSTRNASTSHPQIEKKEYARVLRRVRGGNTLTILSEEEQVELKDYSLKKMSVVSISCPDKFACKLDSLIKFTCSNGDLTLSFNLGGSHITNVLTFDKDDFTSCKIRFLVFLDGREPYLITTLKDGPFVPMSNLSTPANPLSKRQNQWSSAESRLANQDKRLKSLFIGRLPNDVMKPVIKYKTAKEIWTEFCLAYEGPSDTRDTKIVALRLKFNAFKALEGEKRANNSIKDDSLAALYGKYHYEEGLIDDIYASETQRFTIQTSSSKALISNNHFQDSDSDVEEDNITNNEFMADMNAELLSMTDNEERKRVLDYTHVNLQYVEDQRNNLVNKFNALKQDLALHKSELSFGGKGKRKKNNSKKVLFTKADVSTFDSDPMITSEFEDDSDNQALLHQFLRLVVQRPQGKRYSKESGPKVVFGDNSSSDTEGYGLVNYNGITLTKVFCLKKKSDAADCIMSFMRQMENLNDTKMKQLRSNNEIEFKNHTLEAFYDEKVILQNFFSPCIPKQNGVAERKNRTLIEAARTMLNSASLSLNSFREKLSMLHATLKIDPLLSKDIGKQPIKCSEEEHQISATLMFLAVLCTFTITDIIWENLMKRHMVDSFLAIPHWLKHSEFSTSGDKKWKKPFMLLSVKMMRQFCKQALKVMLSTSMKSTPSLKMMKISEEVYVKQESSEFPNHVCKLNKALYRLKQAPRAWYRANPKESHLVVVKRIFRYLKGTPNLGLWYLKGLGSDLKAYSDLNYVGCNLDRKSTSEGCQILGRKLVCWSVKKQTFVAMSSDEAEYVAAAGCCAQVL
nr:uncharacterized mitochondrial protein AtMg00810-like [Tanacetum cinerariifolium]